MITDGLWMELDQILRVRQYDYISGTSVQGKSYPEMVKPLTHMVGLTPFELEQPNWAW